MGSTQVPLQFEQQRNEPHGSQVQPADTANINFGASDSANAGSINYQNNREQAAKAFQAATQNWPDDLETSG
ncbi:hypothetical protein BLL38_12140 [Pseudomonas gessardii]|nr:hypothetical protein BLL38_12140 [Pseudomonas gessardii]